MTTKFIEVFLFFFDAAQDNVQDGFVKCFTNIGKFKYMGEGSLASPLCLFFAYFPRLFKKNIFFLQIKDIYIWQY